MGTKIKFGTAIIAFDSCISDIHGTASHVLKYAHNNMMKYLWVTDPDGSFFAHKSNLTMVKRGVWSWHLIDRCKIHGF